MTEIKVKATFSTWTAVDPIQAYLICKQMSDINGIPASKKARWIEENHLQGCTFAELEKLVNEYISKEVLG